MQFIEADWPAPPGVHAMTSTRCLADQQTLSGSAYDAFNCAAHVGDDAQQVIANRAYLRHLLPGEPLWLQQVHGARCIEYASFTTPPIADACYSRQPGQVCAILTADCLPVVFCDQAGRLVAAAHAGWRGLLEGVLLNTIKACAAPPPTLLAWLGPAIGPDAFEVSDDVYRLFIGQHPDNAKAFQPLSDKTEGKWLADIYQLARIQMRRVGISDIYGGGLCTVSDARSFYSYRRDEGRCGRMATLIWRE